jgi:hypothetical protein
METQSAEYQDAEVVCFCTDYNDVMAYLEVCKKNDILVKFIDWTKNTVTTVERGVYGETYG